MLEKVDSIMKLIQKHSVNDMIPKNLTDIFNAASKLRRSLTVLQMTRQNKDNEKAINEAKTAALKDLKEMNVNREIALEIADINSSLTLDLIDNIPEFDGLEEMIKNGEPVKEEKKEEPKAAEEQKDPQTMAVDEAIEDFVKQDKLSNPGAYSNSKKYHQRQAQIAEAIKIAKENLEKQKEELKKLEEKGEELAEKFGDNLQSRVQVAVAKAAIKTGMMKKEDAPVAEILEAELARNLDAGAAKTITDLFKGEDGKAPDIMELFKNGQIRDKEGNPYTLSTKPQEVIDRFNNDIRNGNQVYVDGLDGTTYAVGGEKSKDNIKSAEEARKNFKAVKERNKLVKPSVKKNTLAQLENLQKSIAEYGKKKKELPAGLKKLDAACRELIPKLKQTPYKDTFNKELRQFSKLCDEVAYKDCGKKKQKGLGTELSIAETGKLIADQAQKEKDPQIDPMQAARMAIATKAVRTFALARRDSSDPALRGRAEDILSDPHKRELEIRNVMKTPAFISLYGSEKKSVDPSVLQEGLEKTGKDIYKEIADKQVSMSKEERKSIINENYKKASKDTRPISKEQKEGLKMEIGQISQQFNQMAGGTVFGGRSPEAEDLRHNLSVLNIALQKGCPDELLRRYLAKLDKASNNYFDKKVGKNLGKFEAQRTSLSGRLKKICNNMNENRLPTDKLPNTPEEMDKQNAAEKLVHETANRMINSGIQEKVDIGNKLLNDPKTFNKEVDRFMQEEAFRRLTEDGGRKLMSMSGKDALDKYAKEVDKLKDEKLEKQIKTEKELKKQAEKAQKEKEKLAAEEAAKKQQELNNVKKDAKEGKSFQLVG